VDKMRIDIEDIVTMLIQRKKLNRPVLSEIEFYRKGEMVVIKKSILDEWDFTGLSNEDFVGMKLLTEEEYNIINKV
jgi:hypothetical protein